MARLLDDPLTLPQRPAAAGRLVDLLDKLAKRSAQRGRLVAVKSMTPIKALILRYSGPVKVAGVDFDCK